MQLTITGLPLFVNSFPHFQLSTRVCSLNSPLYWLWFPQELTGSRKSLLHVHFLFEPRFYV